MPSSSGHVYVFGSGDCGQLGLGEDVDVLKKPRLHNYFEGKDIVSIAAGGLHTLALSSTGQVYSWGCNDEKALGHRAAEFAVAPVEGLENIFITQIAAGDSISASLSSDGKVYTWGTFRDSKGVIGHSQEGVTIQERPTLIGALILYRINYIAAGSNHLMAISEDGNLFAWGCGEQGQLGRRILERHKMLGLRPTNVTPRFGRSKVRVFKVICGSYHTIVLGEIEGGGFIAVFVMGLNNFGQLGLGDHEDRITAEVIDPSLWQGGNPIDAGAGEHHSILLTDKGKIYSFGRTDSGQLGLEVPEGVRACNVPLFIKFFGNIVIKTISAGGNHNLAISQDNNLYSWGYGEMHQLGHGPDEIERFPRKIQMDWKGKLTQVSAGGQHSVVLVRDF